MVAVLGAIRTYSMGLEQWICRPLRIESAYLAHAQPGNFFFLCFDAPLKDALANGSNLDVLLYVCKTWELTQDTEYFRHMFAHQQ